jgi:hypothetical protein
MQVEEGRGALQDVGPLDRVAFGLDRIRGPSEVDRIVLGVKNETAHNGPLNFEPRSDEPLAERLQNRAAVCASEGLLVELGHERSDLRRGPRLRDGSVKRSSHFTFSAHFGHEL